MSDPFAALDPIAATKTPAERMMSTTKPAAIPTPTPMPMPMQAGQFNRAGLSVPPPTNFGMNMGNPNMGMGMGMGMGMPGGMGGMTFGGMGGMPFGGMAPPPQGNMNMGMNMSMGMGMNMPRGMPQQQPSMQAQPVLYDNIKNLLAPKPPQAPVCDTSSLDFLEQMGSSNANSTRPAVPTTGVASAPIDPFGPSLPTTSSTPASMPAAIPISAPTSSAGMAGATVATSPSTAQTIASRRAGRRKTQEMQREQLGGLNANAFAQSSVGSTAPKISLKSMVPTSASDVKRNDGALAPSLEDFAAGKPVFQESSSSRTNSQSKKSTPAASGVSMFDSESGFFSDSDADFDSKLHRARVNTEDASPFGL